MNTHGRLIIAGLAMLLVASLLAGCGGVSNAKLEEFLMQPRAPVSGAEYRVLPPDVISIRSDKVPEINNVVQQVRPDGKVNLPLLGEIYVAGNTPREIEEVIRKEAGRYYRESKDAQGNDIPLPVTVTIANYNSQRIYVFGQVSRPGPQPWTGTNTLLDVLANSQPTTLAWAERIRVVRGQAPKRGGYAAKGAGAPDAENIPAADLGKEHYRKWAQGAEVAEDRSRVIVVNMTDMIEKGDMSHNILLQPDDVVFVEANPLAKVGLAMQQLLFPIRPAMETVSLPASAAAAVP